MDEAGGSRFLSNCLGEPSKSRTWGEGPLAKEKELL